MKKVRYAQQCQKKAYLAEKINLNFKNSKNSFFREGLLNLFNDNVKMRLFTLEEIECSFDKYLSTCTMEKERKASLGILMNYINRMMSFLIINNFIIIDKGIYGEMPLNKDLMHNVIFDLVLERDGIIYPTSIYNKKLGYASKITAKTHISKDVKPYLNWLYAKGKWVGRKISITEIGLQRKNEDSIYNPLTLQEFDINANFFTFNYDNEDFEEVYLNDLKTEIENLKKIKWKEDLLEENKKECMNCKYFSLCHYKPYEFNLRPIIKEKVNLSNNKPKFTEKQQAFINDHKGHIRVIASAGSGKTTCIVNRVMSILNTGIDDVNDLLMITFTDKGVVEMKSKMVKFLSNNEGLIYHPDDFNVFTFNSFGNKIISENYRVLGYSSEPKLIDTLEATDIIRDLLDNCEHSFNNLNYNNPLLNIFSAKGAVPAIYQMFTQMKKKNIKSYTDMENANIAISDDEYENKLLFKLFESYCNEMFIRNLIDYDDQLFIAKALLENEDIAKRYKFAHILVDEAQDTSLEQFDLLDRLIAVNGMKSYVVCGDDSQSIYGFRGVNMDALINFNQKFPDTKDYLLMDNFRSTEEIINLANSIISLNDGNIPKAMIPHKNGDNPTIYIQPSKMVKQERIEMEANYIVSNIRKMIEEKGLRPHQLAVIARTKRELEKVSELLNEYNIPNIVAYPELFIDSVEIQAIKGLSNMFNDTAETFDVSIYLKVFKENTFKNTYNLEETCIMERELLKESIINMTEEEKLNEFLNIVNKFIKVPAVKELLNLFSERNYKNIYEINEYLERLFLYKGNDSYNSFMDGYEAITLTTAHSAKGREWDYVAIMLNAMMPEFVSLDDGIFRRSIPTPSKKLSAEDIKDRFMKTKEEREELTRLLFVAITRAKKYLTIVD